MADNYGRKDQERETPSPDYEVGYRRPPRHSQFRKGESGNPHGGSKRQRDQTTDIAAIVQKAFAQKVSLVINGRTIGASKLEAFIVSVIERGIRSDRGARWVFEILRQWPQTSPQRVGPDYKAELQRKLDEMARRWQESQGLEDDKP